MQQVQPPHTSSDQKTRSTPKVQVLVGSSRGTADTVSRPWKVLKYIGLSSGLLALLAIGTVSAAAYQRYGNPSLEAIALSTKTVEGHRWVGEDISFQQTEGNLFDVTFTLREGETKSHLTLEGIDLSLLIPTVPLTAHGNETLVQWFLTEREFNRQRVIFEAGSPHIDVSKGTGRLCT